MLYENKGRYIVQFRDIPSPRQHPVEIEVDERRGSYREVELGFDEERALREAKRCLSCRRCLGCALCWAECKPEAIQFEMKDEIFDLEADDVIISPGVERALERIDRRFALGREPNVITDLQLERMLSDSGPTAGLVMRPFDGDIPQRIAFVQSYESAPSPLHHAALCFAINEAILVRQKLPDTRIRMFASNFDELLAEQKVSLKALEPISIVRGKVSSVEADDQRSLVVAAEADRNSETAVYDLVVLITQPQISKDARDLTKSLGLGLSYASFLSGEGTGLISTEKEEIRLAAQG